jgi:hypothetical protein
MESGGIRLNLTGAESHATGGGSMLEVVSASSRRTAAISQYANSIAAPILSLAKYRGTPAAPTAVLNGDSVGQIQLQGYDGSLLRTGALISTVATENWGSFRGTNMIFSTIATGEAGTIERFRLSGSGDAVFTTSVAISNSTAEVPNYQLDIAGGSLNASMQLRNDSTGTGPTAGLTTVLDSGGGLVTTNAESMTYNIHSDGDLQLESDSAVTLKGSLANVTTVSGSGVAELDIATSDASDATLYLYNTNNPLFGLHISALGADGSGEIAMEDAGLPIKIRIADAGLDLNTTGTNRLVAQRFADNSF